MENRRKRRRVVFVTVHLKRLFPLSVIYILTGRVYHFESACLTRAYREVDRNTCAWACPFVSCASMVYSVCVCACVSARVCMGEYI